MSMQYRCMRDLMFAKAVPRGAHTIVPEGALVDAVQLTEVPEPERSALDSMQRRHVRHNPTERLVLFRWEGRVRGAVAGRDMTVAKTGRRRIRRRRRNT